MDFCLRLTPDIPALHTLQSCTLWDVMGAALISSSCWAFIQGPPEPAFWTLLGASLMFSAAETEIKAWKVQLGRVWTTELQWELCWGMQQPLL